MFFYQWLSPTVAALILLLGFSSPATAESWVGGGYGSHGHRYHGHGHQRRSFRQHRSVHRHYSFRQHRSYRQHYRRHFEHRRHYGHDWRPVRRQHWGGYGWREPRPRLRYYYDGPPPRYWHDPPVYQRYYSPPRYRGRYYDHW